jgi:glutathione S-transferase
LQDLTELYPQLQPRADDAIERARLRQWLSFIGTELHKALTCRCSIPRRRMR